MADYITTTLAAIQLANEMRDTGQPPVKRIPNTGANPADQGMVWYSCALSGEGGTVWLNNVDSTLAPDTRNNTLNFEMIPIVALSWWVAIEDGDLDVINEAINSSSMTALSAVYNVLTGKPAESMWTSFTMWFNAALDNNEIELPMIDDPAYAWLEKPTSRREERGEKE